MNSRTLQAAFVSLLSAMLVAACSTKGPDIVDPESSARRQVSLFGIDGDSTGGEVLLYSEKKGLLTDSNFASANGGQPLDLPVDGIYENSGQVYLHHREDHSVTVLDLQTRRRLATITGFMGNLTGMAFSNMSQGWVVASGSLDLYELDLKNLRVAHTYRLPDSATSVGTVKQSVFVGVKGPENSGRVAVFKSNARTIAIERILEFPSPIIYMFPTTDSTRCIMLSSGGATSNPTLYYINATTLEKEDEYEITSVDLTDYIGQQPNYAGYTRNDYLYLATPSTLLEYDVLGLNSQEVFIGSYSAIAVDYITQLLYAYDPGRRAVLRLTSTGEELPEISVPSPVNAIKFLGSNRVVIPD